MRKLRRLKLGSQCGRVIAAGEGSRRTRKERSEIKEKCLGNYKIGNSARSLGTVVVGRVAVQLGDKNGMVESATGASNHTRFGKLILLVVSTWTSRRELARCHADPQPRWCWAFDRLDAA